ncbi:POT family protein [Xylaria sp. CBS 124048]|nr:POT family protein [Xylaria sp. CBS 124048]
MNLYGYSSALTLHLSLPSYCFLISLSAYKSVSVLSRRWTFGILILVDHLVAMATANTSTKTDVVAVEPGIDIGIDIDIEKGQQQTLTKTISSSSPDPIITTPIVDHERYPPPSEAEKTSLRKVADTIPWTAWTLCFVELAERASYYGVKAGFNNFLQFPLPDGGDGSGAIDPRHPDAHAGALNLGLQTASALVLLFTFLAYIIPIFGAWWADVKIGRYAAIVYGVLIGALAHVIMIGGAAPALLKAGKGVAPFLVSFFVLAIGAGIFKPNVAPTLIDQYEYQRQYTKVLASGEKVLVDPETTVSHIVLIFYAFVNIGAFFSIAVVYIEKYRGFWLAFLAPGIVYFLLPVLLAVMYNRTIKKPPIGSDLTNFIKITMSALKQSRGNVFAKTLWHNVQPTTLAAQGVAVPYSAKAVADAQRTWEAVQIFLYIPIWTLNDGGVGSALSNLGAAMTSDGAPNDLLNNFNALTIIVVSPVMAHGVYPFLARKKIKFGRIDRMTFGFVLATLSGVIAAVVQYLVYKTSPCGYQASTCAGVSPISIWWQLPTVSLGAISEVFVNVTAYELAYARAPANMRACVISIYLFMTALSSALGEILVPAIVDPTLVWAWAAPAIALAAQTVVFVWRHRHMNDDAFMTYEEDFDGTVGEKEKEKEKKTVVSSSSEKEG